MKIYRQWAMPNKNTFSIKPVKEFIERNIFGELIIDPYANTNKLATITNDLDNQFNTDYNLDSIDFLKLFKDNEVDFCLFDPPFSPRQVSECYRKLDKTVNTQTTQASFWSNQKKELSRIVKNGGGVITCGWNSGGIGEKYGFEIQEILLVAHGGWHNDTIITFEKKVR